MTNSDVLRRLDFWEEACGSLDDLEGVDGSLIAKIGKSQIILPSSLEQNLRELIGQRITILRTDIPEKPYLFRLLDLEPTP